MTQELLIDDFGPLPLVRPASVAELCEMVRSAGPGQAVYPVGGQTQLALGMPPAKAGVAVDLRALDQVIDYPARDMTITVQAGITLARLQEILAAENQRLPIDAPQADRATLGGILATNTSGPRRYGFGTLRDYVIGISVINDDGQEVKAGGRVVKNVAGYDLCKLYIGSLGTLGVTSQVTLKVRPRPEEQAVITLGCDETALATLLDQLHRSRTRPVCIDVLSHDPRLLGAAPSAAAARPPPSWSVAVGYEDNRDAVKWQLQELVRELGGSHDLHAYVSSSAGPLWHVLTELPAWPAAGLTFRASVLPSAVAPFCLEASRLGEPLLLQAHAGNGVVVGHAAELSLDRAAALVQALRERAAAVRGQVVLLRCPPAWKSRLSVWGPSPESAWLMRTVKENLDPRRLFNPGRFVDGI